MRDSAIRYFRIVNDFDTVSGRSSLFDCEVNWHASSRQGGTDNGRGIGIWR